MKRQVACVVSGESGSMRPQVFENFPFFLSWIPQSAALLFAVSHFEIGSS